MNLRWRTHSDHSTQPHGKRTGRLGQVFPGEDKATGMIRVKRGRLASASPSSSPTKDRVWGNLHRKVCNEAACAMLKNIDFRGKRNMTLHFAAVWPRAVFLKMWPLVQ